MHHVAEFCGIDMRNVAGVEDGYHARTQRGSCCDWLGRFALCAGGVGGTTTRARPELLVDQRSLALCSGQVHSDVLVW